MALETQKISVFQKDDGAALDRLLRARHDARPEIEAQAEAVRLQPILAAAADVLAPYARTHHERRSVSAKGLARAFEGSAAAYRSTILNMPVIMAESVLYPRAEGAYRGGIESIKTPLPHLGWAQILEPKRNANKQKRMFGTGYFGFITVSRHIGRDNTHSIAQPYVALPDDFMAIADRSKDGRELLQEFGRLSFLVNHDWFHSILVGSINRDVARPSIHAPAVKYLNFKRAYSGLDVTKDAPGDRRIANFVHDRNLRTMDRLWPQLASRFAQDPYEEWPMRLQREILTAMASKPDSVLAQAVRRYRVAWDAFSVTADKDVMDSVKMTPADFAMKLLAFNLVRAVPADHALVAAAVAGTGAEAIFDKIYAGKMARTTLFGRGGGYAMPRSLVRQEEICDTPAEYGAAVLEASAQAIGMAARDARQAFHYERMKPVERAAAIELVNTRAVVPQMKI